MMKLDRFIAKALHLPSPSLVLLFSRSLCTAVYLRDLHIPDVSPLRPWQQVLELSVVPTVAGELASARSMSSDSIKCYE